MKKNYVAYLFYLFGFLYLGWQFLDIFVIGSTQVLHQEVIELKLIKGLLVVIVFVLIGIGYDFKKAMHNHHKK